MAVVCSTNSAKCQCHDHCVLVSIKSVLKSRDVSPPLTHDQTNGHELVVWVKLKEY